MDHGRVGTDFLSHRSGDFGLPRSLSRFRLSTPVCIDAIGETWAGYIAQGEERGRIVLLTLSSVRIEGPLGEQMLAATLDAKRVRHPKLLAFLELARQDDTCALVNEYLDGEPLSTLLSTADAQSIPIPQGVAIAIVKETIDALVSLRERNRQAFPFGGLSPDVIFVASFGETMLRNPGIEAHAMTLAECRRHPSSLPYRAPEQLSGPAFAVESADVFSSGVILWEMLAGKPLFGGASHLRLGRLKALPGDQLEAMEDRVQTMDIPSLAKIQRHGGSLHPAVIELVRRTLERDPTRRPATLAALSQMIEELPGSLVAAPEEIAATIEKLAGRAIQKRQRLLQDGAPLRVYGSEPPSSRATSALGGAERFSEAREASSPAGGKRGSGDVMESARITAPMRPNIEDPFDPKTKVPRRNPRSPTGALAIVEALPLLAEIRDDTDPPESSDGHSSKTPPGHQITVVVPPRSLPRWVWIAATVLVVGGGLAFTISSQNNGVSAARSSTIEEDLSAANPEIAPPDEGSLRALPTEAAPKLDAVAEDAAALPKQEPQAGDPEQDRRQLPKGPRPARPAPKKKTEEESSGAFRPMGI